MHICKEYALRRKPGRPRWILWFAPIGIFVLSLGLAARGGAGIAGALGQYVIVVCGLISVGIVALYPIAALIGRVSMRRFARACASHHAPGQTLLFVQPGSATA